MSSLKVSSITHPSSVVTAFTLNSDGSVSLFSVKEAIFTIPDVVAFEVNPINGAIQVITLGASRTPKATGFESGHSVTLMIDDGTAYSITWNDTTWGPTGVIWESDGGVAPTLSLSGYTVVTLWKVGTQVYGARVGNA